MLSELVILTDAAKIQRNEVNDNDVGLKIGGLVLSASFGLIATIFAVYLAYQCKTFKLSNAIIKYICAIFFPYIFIVAHYVKKFNC